MAWNKLSETLATPDHPILGKCETCKLMQAIASSEANWFMRIPVQITSVTTEHVTKSMKIFQPSFNVKTAKEYPKGNSGQS